MKTFRVDRNSTTDFLNVGVYRGKIEFPKELDCTPKGDLKIRMRFVTATGSITDDFINAPNLWWKIDRLLKAADPTGKHIPITDGTELDLSNDQTFGDFLRRFHDLEVSFAVYRETYTKSNGEEGESTKMIPMDPRRGETQLPKKIQEQLKAARIAAEGPDEVPF